MYVWEREREREREGEREREKWDRERESEREREREKRGRWFGEETKRYNMIVMKIDKIQNEKKISNYCMERELAWRNPLKMKKKMLKVINNKHPLTIYPIIPIFIEILLESKATTLQDEYSIKHALFIHYVGARIRKISWRQKHLFGWHFLKLVFC